MRRVVDRCAALDVHKKTVVAAVRTPDQQEVRTFGTMTRELLAMRDWLRDLGVTHIAMESTGVYWKPVFNLLEDRGFELVVVNARHVKMVPGRKTDVKDAEWLAELLQHGLLKPSFIPNREQRELRELVRYRKSLTEDRSRVVARIQKVLEGANIKLGDVASSVVGMSGRAILEELAAGNEDPEAMAGLALSNLRGKTAQLVEALSGSMRGHQRFMLRTQLDLLAAMDEQLQAIDAEVEQRMLPFQAAIDLLDEIPGVARLTAEQILVEIGTDMSRFPTAEHFASWARLCPGTHESAGQRRPASTGQGNRYLRTALSGAVVNAVRASRAKPNFFAARYKRLAARRGPNRARIAVAHSLLVAIYHMLRNGTHFEDLGANHWDEHHRDAVARRTVERLERLGYAVTLQRVPA